MRGDRDVAREVRFLRRVGLRRVDKKEVGMLGEFSAELAKLPKLAHERRSGAGAEVEDKRPTRLGGGEQGGGHLVQCSVGHHTMFNVTHRAVEWKHRSVRGEFPCLGSFQQIVDTLSCHVLVMCCH